MGYGWAGRCYADNESARKAFVLDVSRSDSGGVVWVSTSSVSGNTVTYSTNYRTFSGSASTVVAKTGVQTTLPICEADLSGYGLGSVVWLIAVFFALIGGFRVGFRP